MAGSDSAGMKTTLVIPFVIAASLSLASAEEKSVGEKASDALKKAGEKTKEVGRVVIDSAKKAGDAVVDAVTPDADARKIEVKLVDGKIDMPRTLDAGKTAFVVSNAGTKKHNFQVRGEGMDKQFLAAVEPGDTKVLHVNLKSGTYEVICPVDGHATGGIKVNLTVK
jgi:uncharacterized cupredoxin-like copper-binding protein